MDFEGGNEGETTSSTTPACDFPGCQKFGEYPAPKGRQSANRLNESDWFWFCLEHVRQYNAAWNYFSDMSEAEIESIRRSDVTWNRPTWSPSRIFARIKAGYTFEDPFSFFTEQVKAQTTQDLPPSPKIEERELDALSQLELGYPYNKKTLRTQYLKLVKKYHPDLHQGAHHLEEKLKKINTAYRFLREALEKKE